MDTNFKFKHPNKPDFNEIALFLGVPKFKNCFPNFLQKFPKLLKEFSYDVLDIDFKNFTAEEITDVEIYISSLKLPMTDLLEEENNK